ncbi:MAG TPA: fructosamine kinase family protein [Anaerolineales bacterium]|nr:fructosamine kinase family protein [Anaerolineales bacterium]
MAADGRPGAGLPQAAADWIASRRAGAIVSVRPVGGGCIHNGRLVETAAGYRFFIKSSPDVPADLFETEASGLDLLRKTGCIRVPSVLAVGEDFLLQEYLPQGKPRRDYWPALGRRLACLHSCTADRFGLDHDNYLGSTPQPNTTAADGYAFFAENRLGYQAELAGRRGLISSREVRRVEAVANRLREWVPEQPASLLHGDLWTGNLLQDERGDPALIDPAAHYGWREADLAMLSLFGSPPEDFYAAYREIIPLPPALRDRFPLYNLYHLLNHLNIFGPSYYGQVVWVLDRFE